MTIIRPNAKPLMKVISQERNVLLRILVWKIWREHGNEVIPRIIETTKITTSTYKQK